MRKTYGAGRSFHPAPYACQKVRHELFDKHFRRHFEELQNVDSTESLENQAFRRRMI